MNNEKQQQQKQEVVERYKGQGEKSERLEQDKKDAQEKELTKNE